MAGTRFSVNRSRCEGLDPPREITTVRRFLHPRRNVSNFLGRAPAPTKCVVASVFAESRTQMRFAHTDGCRCRCRCRCRCGRYYPTGSATAVEFLQKSYEVPARDRFSVTHAISKRRLYPKVELAAVKTDGHRPVAGVCVGERGVDVE